MIRLITICLIGMIRLITICLIVFCVMVTLPLILAGFVLWGLYLIARRP